MAIIVEHIKTYEKYLLVGTGYGAYKSARESFFGGNVFPHVEEGEVPVAAVCDGNGKISWVATDEIRVIEVDGVKVSNFKGLHKPQGWDGGEGLTEEEDLTEICPACNTRVSEKAKECYSCGLTLIDEEEF